MIKDAEIESLKKNLKELKETIEENDTGKEIQDLKKQYSFTKKEKEMKDIMIDQLKRELEKNITIVMEAKEKESQMAATINTLTTQLANATVASAMKGV